MFIACYKLLLPNLTIKHITSKFYPGAFPKDNYNTCKKVVSSPTNIQVIRRSEYTWQAPFQRNIWQCARSLRDDGRRYRAQTRL